MKNIADQDILFKVKTTLPSTYFVDPNQDCLKVGEEVTVNVIMMNDECLKFIKNYLRGSEETAHKHMFKVEAVPISPTVYTDLKALEPANRSATYNRLLSSTEATMKSVAKFRVAFTYPARDPAQELTSISESGEGAPSAPPAQAEPNVEQPPAGRNSNSTFEEKTANDQNSIDGVLSELQALRARYDKVLELTVHLTAEKDTMLARLEAKQNERKEKSRQLERDRKGAKAMAGAMKKKGVFSLTSVCILAFIAFWLGYYLEEGETFTGTRTTTVPPTSEL